MDIIVVTCIFLFLIILNIIVSAKEKTKRIHSILVSLFFLLNGLAISLLMFMDNPPASPAVWIGSIIKKFLQVMVW